jgi:archaellum component FlaF (FlaF/FlaG flagellin family)
VAGTVLVVVVILIAVGIHSCEVSQRNTALKDYANSVASLIQRSDQTGSNLFSELSGAGGASNVPQLQTQLNQTTDDAGHQLSNVKGLSVPDEMKGAQRNLLLVFAMRHDALMRIAGNIQQTTSKSSSGDAVNTIAAEMGRLYASDVIYKDYAAPDIAAALNGVGISTTGPNAQPISGGQFVQDVQWLTPSFVASKLGATIPPARGKPAPGIHGHRMISCSVSGTALVPGGTNTLPASPPPTFSCTFQNDGQNTETDVTVKVQVSGTSVSGQAVQSQTMPGQQYTVNVSLNSSPPTGAQTVTATVERVPGETTVVHNTLTFPITFH